MHSPVRGSVSDSGDSRAPLKPGVEAEDPADALLLHHRDVDGISGRQTPASQQDRFGALDTRRIDWEHLVDDPENGVERWLDSVLAIDGHVSVQDLMEDLGVSDQSLAIRDDTLEQPLRVDLIRVRTAH